MSKNVLETHRNWVQPHVDLTVIWCQHSCNHGNAVFASLPPTQSPWNAHVTFLLNWDLCSVFCVLVQSDTIHRALYRFLHISTVSLCCLVFLSSLPRPRSVSGRVYVLLMPWKPQKFQRFSRLAPTPVSSCLKVQGSRERSASTSLGLICKQQSRTAQG